ncbi:MAG: PIN domain-containing protein [Promethearchaeota archaeon]
MRSINYKTSNLIIIDSNFILLPYQFKIDYLNEIYLCLEGKTKFFIFKQILNELEAKKRREPKARKFRRQFKSGMSYLEKNEKIYPIYFIDEIKNKNETTDEFLLRWCIKFKKEYKCVLLATNDSELRKKAKNLHINVIFLRQKKFLTIKRN